jgi:hypothetical protein
VARPAGFPNHHIKPECGDVVGVRIGLHVFALIGLYKTGIAFDSSNRKRPRSPAGDADGANSSKPWGSAEQQRSRAQGFSPAPNEDKVPAALRREGAPPNSSA